MKAKTGGGLGSISVREIKRAWAKGVTEKKETRVQTWGHRAPILSKKAKAGAQKKLWLASREPNPNCGGCCAMNPNPLRTADSPPLLNYTPCEEPSAQGCPDAEDRLLGWLSWVSGQSSHPAWGATPASGIPSGQAGSSLGLQPSPLPSLHWQVSIPGATPLNFLYPWPMDLGPWSPTCSSMSN